MGLGGALFEADSFCRRQDSEPASFSRYRVPRFSDIPVLETVLAGPQGFAVGRSR